jgi:hypothetical protein
MGSKVKGWHSKAPKGDKRRMYEESSSRKPKDRDRQDRKPHEAKRVDYTRNFNQDS